MEARARLLVTGANGFLGHRVVHAALREGYAVRAMVRRTSRTERLAGLDCEAVYGDLDDADSLRAAVEGCDGILHLASPSRWELLGSQAVERVIVGGTRRLIEAAKAAGGLRTVFVSSAAAAGGSDSPTEMGSGSGDLAPDSKQFPYAAAKWVAEREALNSGVPTVVVRPAEIYGPDDRDEVTAGNLRSFLGRGPVLVCAGGTHVAHVDDVALAVVRAWELGQAGECYFCGGERLTVAELAALTLRLAGKEERAAWVLPRRLIRTTARWAERLGLPYPVPPALIPYATRYWYFSEEEREKTEAALGVSFRDAEATLAPTVAWLLGQANAERGNVD